MNVVVALLVVLVIASLACLVGAALTVVPFVVGVDMAERRGYSTDRWGALCLLGPAAAMALGYVVHASGSGRVLYLPVALLAWAGPGLLAVLAAGQPVGGPQGVHER